MAKISKSVISLVLGSYNRRAFLKAAVESIRQNGITVPYEIIVIDGGSTDGSIEWLARQKDVIIILQHNRSTLNEGSVKKRSWGYFMNLGFKCAEGKYVVMISDDSLLVPGAVMNGLRHYELLQAQGRSIGAVAFYWRNWPEQAEYWVGLTHGEKMFVNHGMYLRDALQRVGWIEEDRYHFYYADGDLCLKMWNQGYEVVDCPAAFVEHYSHTNTISGQSNLEHELEDRRAYEDRWRGVFYDPDKPNKKDWIYLAHEDVSRTAEKFRKVQSEMKSHSGMLCKLKNVFSLRESWRA